MKGTQIWSAVHDERRALASDLVGLDASRWSTPSLCPGWDVLDVIAHLVDVAKTTRTGFVRRIVAARFDFDQDNADGVATERRGGPDATLAELNRVADWTATPPAPLVTRLIEELVHGEDVRRPLGIDRDYPAEPVAAALKHMVGTSVRWGGGRERAAGLRLIADDTPDEEALGDGPRVRGPAIALLLAVSGRPVRDGELTGDGAQTLRDRRGFTPQDPDGQWALVHAERRALADDLHDLTDEQWATPSLCDEFSVRETLAHLTVAATLTPAGWMRGVLRAGFDVDKQVATHMAKHLGDTPADTLDRFRRAIDNRTKPPLPLVALLGEVVIHGEDIRHPLGLHRAYPPGALARLAEYYAGTNLVVPAKSRIQGLRLQATDGPFATGSGPLITGPTLALIMAMTGRAAYLGELDGDGVATLRERCA